MSISGHDDSPPVVGGVDKPFVTTQDVATKNYATQDDLGVLKAGDTMSGDLSMGDNAIKGLADPADPQDAANRRYTSI